MTIIGRPAFRRIVTAVVAAEIRRLRHADLPNSPDWEDTTPIGDQGLGLDSLERLSALGGLAEVFGLDDATLPDRPARYVGDWVDWVIQGHPPGGSRITVKTSGSTGPSVSCTHPLSDLADEAGYFAQRLADRRRIVALVPAHHLYGLIWTALLPDALGVPVVMREIGTALDLVPGDLVVAVPDQWRAIRMLTRQFPGDIIGVSSAAPLQDMLADALIAAGLAGLFDIYGSSETGGIAIREHPATEYDLLPRWSLLPRDGDWELTDGCGARYALPDHIDRTGERRIRPTGRRDGAVQIGGHNVSLTHVAETLRRIDGVADAAVRLHGNDRLKAFVVPGDGRDPAELAKVIEESMAASLSVPERPRNLTFGPALPRNTMGKLADWT
ncbi:acyl-CoA synthetase [Sphingomonas sp. CFBP8993]|nr:acyl-CoA synthetase [Sphingomonas sp. CFBP8993]